jgi:hypothetical protein
MSVFVSSSEASRESGVDSTETARGQGAFNNEDEQEHRSHHATQFRMISDTLSVDKDQDALRGCKEVDI